MHQTRAFYLAFILLALGSGVCAGSDRPMSWRLGPSVVDAWSSLMSGESASIAIVGDSISTRRDSWNWFFRDRLWAEFGRSGDGYYGVGGAFNANHPVTDPRNGPRWPQSLRRSSGVVRGVLNGPRDEPWGTYEADGIYARFGGSDWVEIDVFGTAMGLHYLVQPGGGTLRVEIDGATIDELDTSAAEVGHGVVMIPTGAPDDETITTVRFTSADGDLVQIAGVELLSGVAGARCHRLGRGGQGPRDFLRSVNEPVASFFGSLSPDILIVMLDWSGEDERLTYESDMNDLLDFYEGALPGVPIVLVTHHPFRSDIEEEADILLSIAQERGHGYVNLFDLFEGFAAMDLLGLMDDTVHLTPLGGAWFGDYMYDMMSEAAADCMTDVTGDGGVDFDDLNSVLNAWATPVAPDDSRDIDRSGVVDFADLNAVLDRWGCECD